MSGSEEINQHLDQILQRPEYQPRGLEPDFWERLGSVLHEYASPYLEKAIDWINSWMPDTSQAPPILADIIALIVRLLGLLNYGLALVLFAAIAWGIYALAKSYFSSRHPEHEKRTGSLSSQAAQQYQLDLEGLLRDGQWRKLLLALRMKLRLYLRDSYNISLAKTDREVCSQLDPEPSTRTTTLKRLFSKVVELFERTVFAQAEVPEQSIKAAYKDYCASQQTGQPHEAQI